MNEKKGLEEDRKREETLEILQLAVRDWPKMKFKARLGVLNLLKFESKYLRPEELEEIKKEFISQGMKEKVFDDMIRRGRQVEGIPEPEGEAFGEVDQAKLDKLLEATIPKEGFIKDYLDIFSRVTDTPKTFLLWGAMVAVAAVLGKRVWIPWEARKLYPNIWGVFLAPSGFRKGTGIDIPTLLLRKVDSSLLLPQVGSEEGLTKALAEETDGKEVGFVRWQEFSKILKGWSTTGSWQASQEFWIDLWDNKPLRKKLSGGEFTIPVTSVSFLSASTLKGFSKFFTPEDLEGGFFGRVYLITCLKKKRYFEIPPSVEKVADLNGLVKQLHKIKEHFKDKPLSYVKFEEPFRKWARKTQAEHEQGFLDSFYARIETHCMKLAMIYEAASTGKIEIREESFELATQALKFLIASAGPLVSEEIGTSEDEKRTKKILSFIQEKGEVARRDVMRKFGLSRWDMDRIEGTLEDREAIEILTERTKEGAGRPKKSYFVK
ncbi:hypothetical protein ES702_02029 [subsurface metagenome]